MYKIFAWHEEKGQAGKLNEEDVITNWSTSSKKVEETKKVCDAPINRESVELVLLRVSADTDYFTVALIMKMIITNIQLNSQIN